MALGVIGLTLLAPGAGHAHPPAIVSPAGERALGEEVAAFLADVRTAIARKDKERLGRLYSDGFTHVDAAGRRRDRAEHLAAIARGEVVVEAGESRERQVRAPNDWVVVATGAARLAGAPSRSGRVQFTIVATRAGESWQLAATHVTSSTIPSNSK